MYDTILVPTDGSEISERAAEEAFALAREFDATVHVLFVIDESASSFLFTPGRMADVLAAFRDEAEAATDAAAALADDDVDVVVDIVRGMSVDGTIVDYATDNGVDLVVMGTHGRHGVEHLLGSTTQRVLTSTPIPVLVVGKQD